jgi:hypothetical protein
MGTFSSWINYITNPSKGPTEVIQALQALDPVIDELYQALYIKFSYSVYYLSTVHTVEAALKQVGDTLNAIASPTPVQVISIPNYGGVLTDATLIASLVMHKDGDLQLGQCYLELAPTSGDLSINLLKNGTLVGNITYSMATSGYREQDLSSITVVKGDLLTLFCVTSGGAGGLSMCLEY